MDISEDGYGIGFLNDCKYGVHVQDGTVGFTLIKSGIYPNPQADQEEHFFTYSLYPHQDGWRQGNVPRQAYQLNHSMTANVKKLEGGSLEKEYSTVSVSAENVMVEAVKPAEDSDDLVVRMYECYNRRTKVTVKFPQKMREIYRCNLLEEEDRLEAVNENSFQVDIAPYEILTFKVKR